MNEEQKARIHGIYKDISTAADILEDAKTRLDEELGGDVEDITSSLYYTVKEIYDILETIANLPTE